MTLRSAFFFLVVLFSTPLMAQNCSGTNLTPANCVGEYGSLCSQYNTLSEQYTACNCGFDPCADFLAIQYNKALHIAAVFIILIASFLGAGIPILSQYGIIYRLNPFYICLGKCMGIGVVLACALIHMLQPSATSLTSPCVPWEFNTDYNAYAFLYAMLAGLMMQFLDFCFSQYMIKHKSKGSSTVRDAEASGQPEEEKCEKPGHVHSGAFIDVGIQKTIAAYLLEFGVTTHSVFIGLTVGVADDTTVHALLVALVFHQFFEGVALGSRIADAHLPSHWNEFILSFIFAIAAPLGIGIGIAVITTLNPNGETFLMVQGTFDGICGGILLYIGYNLLLKDFPEDMEKHCANSKKPVHRKVAMFCALYLGAGLMAYIGKYL